MYTGVWGDTIFSVGHIKVLTPSNVKGSSGADWAEHSVLEGKTRTQYMGPKLRSYQMDVLLSASHGTAPRSTLKKLQKASEEGEAHYLIIGLSPLGDYPFRLTDISDAWDTIGRYGILTECTVSLTFEEYA